MEELMYYVWQQRLCHTLETTDGQSVEIIHPGIRNVEVGPDFFNAKVKYDGILWAGNVEMHQKASAWYAHHHEENRAYDSVVLHVVLEADAQIYLHDGSELKTVVMKIPDEVMKRYYDLCGYPSSMQEKTALLPGQRAPYSNLACGPRLNEVPPIIVHDWINALAIQRMLGKMQRVQQAVEKHLKSWEEGFYTILLRSMGSGTNSDAMERLAQSLPFSCLLHHRDNLLQLRAMLLGQAGLIDPSMADHEALMREYIFLRNKFSLTPLQTVVWKMSRLRPMASPQCRLESVAILISKHPNLFGEVIETKDIVSLERLFTVKGIGQQTVRIIIINAVIPALLSYFKWQGDDERCEEVIEMLGQLPGEQNRYTAQWQKAGIEIRSALDSQALLHLTQNYCQLHKCLQCRIGWWMVKGKESKE